TRRSSDLRRVGLVCQEGIGPRAWPALPGPGHAQVAQQDRQGLAVVRLARSDDHCQWTPSSVDGVMDLRGQPAAGATDRVTGRFVVRLRTMGMRGATADLGTAGVGRVLVSTVDRGVDRDDP